MRAGLVILDIADVTAPQFVGSLDVSPPLGSSIALHSAIPLPDRDLVIINSEALNERCREPLNYAAVVDVSDDTDPVLISMFPVPEPPEGYPHETFCEKGGRFGPHNQHQPQNQAVLEPTGDIIYLTYFNAGLQVYDISKPYAPKIVGHYIPHRPDRAARRAPHRPRDAGRGRRRRPPRLRVPVREELGRDDRALHRRLIGAAGDAVAVRRPAHRLRDAHQLGERDGLEVVEVAARGDARHAHARRRPRRPSAARRPS